MDNKQAVAWFQNRLKAGILPGARAAFEAALAALEAADDVKIVRCQDCEWSNCYDATERTRWVAVEEHIPKNRYLLCTDGDAVYVAMLALDGTWRSPNWGLCRHPTHWMLLPKPPKIFV